MAYLFLALCFGLATAIVGKLKGGSFLLWLAIGTLIPGIGLIAALLHRWDNRELRRQCPRCGKLVKLHDAKCMTCGEELEFPAWAVESEASAAERRRLAGAKTP